MNSRSNKICFVALIRDEIIIGEVEYRSERMFDFIQDGRQRPLLTGRDKLLHIREVWQHVIGITPNMLKHTHGICIAIDGSTPNAALLL